MQALTDTQAERFWRKVERRESDECWEWQASTIKQGYGSVGFNGKTFLAHRVAWALCNGPIPHDMLICHTCDNPPCCNPRHLFLGTQRDNMHDMKQKSRANHPQGDRTGGRVASKLGWETARKIRECYASGMFTCRTLGKMFSVSGATVARIVNHKLWKENDHG